MQAGAGERWSDHRVTSWLLRALVLLAPFATSVGGGLAYARLVERPSGGMQVLWWTGLLVLSALTLLVVERIARRILPLAALLRLTLIFPDHAPSRMSVALRTMNARRMQQWAEELADERLTTGEETDESQLAERATAVLTLAAALNAHDRRTRGHSERVRALTTMVADELDLDEESKRNLQWAGLLHDIGKLTVPAQILNKAGKPDEDEWHVLQRHPAEGARIAEPLGAWLGAWIGAIGEHHEKYDGTGYPRGLAGHDITLAGRVVSVTDSFETMTAVRSYKRPLSVVAAREELIRCSGNHFDPVVVRAFLSISLGRLYWKVGIAAWFAQLPLIGLLPRAGAEVATIAGGSTLSATAAAGVAALVLGAGLSISGIPSAPADGTPGGPGTPVSPSAAVTGEAGTQSTGDVPSAVPTGDSGSGSSGSGNSGSGSSGSGSG